MKIYHPHDWAEHETVKETIERMGRQYGAKFIMATETPKYLVLHFEQPLSGLDSFAFSGSQRKLVLVQWGLLGLEPDTPLPPSPQD